MPLPQSGYDSGRGSQEGTSAGFVPEEVMNVWDALSRMRFALDDLSRAFKDVARSLQDLQDTRTVKGETEDLFRGEVTG